MDAVNFLFGDVAVGAIYCVALDCILAIVILCKVVPLSNASGEVDLGEIFAFAERVALKTGDACGKGDLRERGASAECVVVEICDLTEDRNARKA